MATSPVSVALTWNSVANAIGYRIERCSETNAFVQIADVTPAASTFQTFVDSGLTADTAYAYRVTAYNAIGTSAPLPGRLRRHAAAGHQRHPDHG